MTGVSSLMEYYRRSANRWAQGDNIPSGGDTRSRTARKKESLTPCSTFEKDRLSRAWRARPSSVSGSRLLASPPGVSSVLAWGRMGGTCGIHPTLYVLVPSPWPTHHLAPPQKPIRHRPSAINMLTPCPPPPFLGDARGPFLPNHIFGDACGLRGQGVGETSRNW